MCSRIIAPRHLCSQNWRQSSWVQLLCSIPTNALLPTIHHQIKEGKERQNIGCYKEKDWSKHARSCVFMFSPQNRAGAFSIFLASISCARLAKPKSCPWLHLWFAHWVCNYCSVTKFLHLEWTTIYCTARSWDTPILSEMKNVCETELCPWTYTCPCEPEENPTCFILSIWYALAVLLWWLKLSMSRNITLFGPRHDYLWKKSKNLSQWRTDNGFSALEKARYRASLSALHHQTAQSAPHKQNWCNKKLDHKIGIILNRPVFSQH